jgi:SAM-dependent methyltransferase
MEAGKAAPESQRGLGREEQIALIAKAVGYSSPDRYVKRAEFLFQGVDLTGKRVLDIGCGPGAWTLWAGLNGASYALGIDPEGAGATEGVLARLRRTVEQLGLGATVEGRPIGIEELGDTEPFDVIINYNVINHISEEHTRTLDRPESYAFYVAAIRSIKDRLRPGGVLITADCSRHNFFADLGMTNPMARSIEWQNHRAPEEWAGVMRDAGLQPMDLRWSYMYPLTRLSPPGWLAYFVASHFVLRMRRGA